MEVDKNLTEFVANLYFELSKSDVIALDLLLRVNRGWPILEPLTAYALLIKMMELGLWKVDLQRRECHLEVLIFLLDKIKKPALSAEVRNFGQ